MRVLSHGKKKPNDNYTILELEFTFTFDNKPRKVGKLRKIRLNNKTLTIHFCSFSLLRSNFQKCSGSHQYRSGYEIRSRIGSIICFFILGRFLSLEDCLPKDTAKHFPSFMLQVRTRI